MSRSLGAIEVIHALLPEEAALALGLVTQFGDVWFLVGASAVAYLFRPQDRDRVAVVLGLALATAAVVEALKAVFGLPRPATPLATAEAYPVLLQGVFEATATASGEGFPSGHATLSTVVLLGLAGAVRIGDARERFGIATALIAVIGLSRVALGVHYVVDVAAGVLVGLALLVGVAWATETSPLDGPTTAFAIAAAIGVAGVAITAGSLGIAGAGTPPPHDSVLALGAALGALAGWQTLRLRTTNADDRHSADDQRRAAPRRRSIRALLAGALLLALATLAAAGVLLDDGTALVSGAAGVGAAAAVALPALVPDFDVLVAGYVPQWLRGAPAGAGE